MAFINPMQYGPHGIGPIASRSAVGTVPEGMVWIATDTRIISAKVEGAWVDIADLTAAIPWSSILSKPDTFPPSEHDLSALHSGTLPIARVVGHDLQDANHRYMAVAAMVLGQF